MNELQPSKKATVDSATQPESEANTTEAQDREAIQMLEKAGLQVVLTNHEGWVLFGGKTIQRVDLGYTSSEPAFSIYHRGSTWIAQIENMESEYDENLVQGCGSVGEAAEFICSTYAEWKRDGIL